jgi:hypothetical protein
MRFSVIEVPGSVKLLPTLICFLIPIERDAHAGAVTTTANLSACKGMSFSVHVMFMTNLRDLRGRAESIHP